MSASFSPALWSHDGSNGFCDESHTAKPSNPICDFLSQHREKSIDALFELLSGDFSAAEYQERPLSVPPFTKRNGRLVETDHEFRDEKSQWAILGLMQNLCNTQRSVALQRYARHRQRVDLKLKRDEAADVGADLMNKLNALVPELSVLQEYSNLHGAVTEVLDVFERFQLLRDEYQAEESDYREDEKGLDREEFRLEEVENDFRNKLNHIDRLELTALFGDYASSHGDATGTPSAPDVQEEYHPLVYEYLSSVGYAYDLREELWEASTGRQALLQEQDARRQDGLTLDEETLAHLHDLEQNEKNTLEELAQVDKEIQRLGLECESQGLDVNPHSHTDYEDNVKPDLSSSLTAVDLQQPWRERGPSFFEGFPEMSQPINMTHFIDKWILDQLCHSSFEVLMRKTVENQANTSLENIDSLDYEKEEAFRDLVMGSWAEDMVFMTMPPPPTEELNDKLVGVSDGIESAEEQDAGRPEEIINLERDDRDDRSTMKDKYTLEQPDISAGESHSPYRPGLAGPEFDIEGGENEAHKIHLGVSDNPNISTTTKDDSVAEKALCNAKDRDEHVDDSGKIFIFGPDVPEHRDRDDPLETPDTERETAEDPKTFWSNFFPGATDIHARWVTIKRGHPLSQWFSGEISETEISENESSSSSSYCSNTIQRSNCRGSSS